jgi:hypothetical protein
MGVITYPEQQTSINRKVRPPITVWLPAALYAVFAAAAIVHHEPWADEAQSWLLARDASLADLWTRLLHYEGTPGLWQTILHAAIALGMPYPGLNFISGALGFAAACLMFSAAPFPLAIRLALPFTFFLCYQYAVVARSYALLPVLLFTCAILYRQALQRPYLFTILLCLIAAVSLHGFAVSLAIWLAFHICHWTKKLAPAAVLYLCALSLIALAAAPAKDVTFVTGMNYSVGHLLTAAGNAFGEAFTGEPISSALVVLLSIPLLWRGRGLLTFALASVFLCLVGGIVYSQVWHYGILFLAWLFALWISAMNLKPPITALAALAIVIAAQCYATLQSIRYDWNNPYSGSREAAMFLRSSGIPDKRLVAVGYACTAVQPYFPRNIFANWNTAYYDWSRRNHSIQDVDRLDRLHPDYVLIGHLNLAEKLLWNDSAKVQGYRLVKHFEGNLFWKTDILEPESFDLYQRP